MFDESLCKYTSSKYTIEFKDDAKPFPIPNIHEPSLNKEDDRID